MDAVRLASAGIRIDVTDVSDDIVAKFCRRLSWNLRAKEGDQLIVDPLPGSYAAAAWNWLAALQLPLFDVHVWLPEN